MKDITPILQSLGLLDSEVKVYRTSLTLGATTVVDLSKKTQLSRQAVYTAIQNLMERGLMSTIQSGKKRLFTAEDPDRLLEYAKRRENELKNQINDLKEVLPELKLQSGGEKPVVRLYEGKEGVRALIERLSTDKPTEFVEISDLENLYKVISPEELAPIRKAIYKNNPKFRGIYTSKSAKKETKSERIYLSEKYNDFKSDILVYGDKIALITLEGKMYSVIIESPHLANTMRILFDLAFKKKIDPPHIRNTF